MRILTALAAEQINVKLLDYGVDDRQKLFAQIKNEVENAYPDYVLNMALDIDV